MLREAILVCYRSGQMSAAQFERHCEDDPELRTILNRQGLISKEGVAAIENADKEPIRWVWSDGSCHDEPESAPRAKTDLIAAMREALGILCDEIEATEEHGAAAFERFCPVCKAIERARAALVAYDAAVAPSRQSVGVEEIAREIAKRASSGDTSNTPQDVADCIVAEIDNNTESEGSTWRKRRN